MRDPRSRVLLTALLALGGVCLPSAGLAKVEIRTRADGLKVIHNENQEQHARRYASTLVSVPRAEFGALVERHARAQELAPRLVQAVIQCESGYNLRALSAKGAMGLMQLMPATAVELAVSDPYDAEQNIRAGTTYLRRLLDRFGTVELALAAYNAGPTAVQRHGGIPPYRETREYVRRVMSLYLGRELPAAPRVAASKSPVEGKKPVWIRRNGQLVLVTDR
jgi:soluble lytic murein transglycosylase